MAASDLNLVVIGGRLTRNPEARGGGKVAFLSLASNRFFRRDDATVEETTFVDVSAFGFAAEDALKLHKGQRCLIEGRLELNRWTGEDGSNRQSLRLIANRIQRFGPAPHAPEEPVADHDDLAQVVTPEQEAQLV